MAKARGAYPRLSHAAAAPYANHQSDVETSFTDLVPVHTSRDYLEIRPSDERKGNIEPCRRYLELAKLICHCSRDEVPNTDL